jgi:hypothetical protein
MYRSGLGQSRRHGEVARVRGLASDDSGDIDPWVGSLPPALRML